MLPFAFAPFSFIASPMCSTLQLYLSMPFKFFNFVSGDGVSNSLGYLRKSSKTLPITYTAKILLCHCLPLTTFSNNIFSVFRNPSYPIISVSATKLELS